MTYLLDTNIVSDMRRPHLASVAFQAWMDRSALAEYFISTITLLELEVGAVRAQRKRLPHARMLRAWIDDHVRLLFAERILSVTEAVALRCAQLHVPKTRRYADALIAATALAHDFTMVTRNVDDFAPMGVRLLNPWDA